MEDPIDHDASSGPGSSRPPRRDCRGSAPGSWWASGVIDAEPERRAFECDGLTTTAGFRLWWCCRKPPLRLPRSTTVKDYGFVFRDDPALAEPVRRVSALARDITELMTEIGLQPPVSPTVRRVAYRSACSLQPGQKMRNERKRLLKDAGLGVLHPPEGTPLSRLSRRLQPLQPGIATRLHDRKVANIESTTPDSIAAGNIGCMTQVAAGTAPPAVHTAELLDRATGRPRPSPLPNQGIGRHKPILYSSQPL